MENPAIQTNGLTRLFGAIAAGMLKNMLTGTMNRGATIFLTTHVLEIVERLRSPMAIISKGRLFVIRSLDELRAGVASALPGVEQGKRFTLAEIFPAILGAYGHQESTQELSWLA
jgi:ABC-2 type transport system ATP-binding protein